MENEFELLARELGYDDETVRELATRVERDFAPTGNRELDRIMMRQRWMAAFRAEAPVRATQVAAPVAVATTGSGVTITTTPGFNAPVLSLTRVRPGDLITAGFVDGMIDALQVLDMRLRTLETRSVQTVNTGAGTGTTGSATGTGTVTGTGSGTGTVTTSDPKKIAITRAAATLTADKKTVVIKVAGHGLDPDELNVATIGDNIITPSLIKGSDRNIELRIAEQRASFSKPIIQISRRDGSIASAKIETKNGEGLLSFFR